MSIKSLLAHKARLGLTAIAIVLGVGFVSGTMIFSATINESFHSIFESAVSGIDVEVRASAEIGTSVQGASVGTVDESLLPTVAAVDGVDQAVGVIQGDGVVIIDKSGESITTQGWPSLGFNWIGADISDYKVREGNAPTTPDQVMINVGAAKTAGFNVGDQVEIVTPRDGKRPFQIVGFVGTENDDATGDTTLSFWDTETARLLFGEPGKWSVIDVSAKDGVEARDLQERISKVLPDGAEAVTAQSVIDQAEGSLQSQLGFLNTVLLTFAGVAIFVGAFLIYNTFTIIVAQRSKELALLRCLGAKTSQVTASVMIEAVIVAVVASVIGIGLGVLVALGIKELLSGVGLSLPPTPLEIRADAIGIGFAVGIVVTVVSALIPALRAARVPPITAMRATELAEDKPLMKRNIVGVIAVVAGIVLLVLDLARATPELPLALAAVGLIFVGVVVLTPMLAKPLAVIIGAPVTGFMSGKLAKLNTLRNARRTAATATALMIGLALVAFFSILTQSLKDSISDQVSNALRAELIVTNSNFLSYNSEVVELIRENLDTSDVVPVYGSTPQGTIWQLGGEEKHLFGANLGTLTDVISLGTMDTNGNPMTDTGVLISRKAADDNDFNVGDSIAMQFPQGESDVEITGIYAERSLLGDFVLSKPEYEKGYPELQVFVTYATTVPGVSVDDAQKSLEETIASYPNLDVQNQQSFTERISEQIDKLTNMINGLLVLAIVIAFLGITNTLALSIYERVREIGLLRAVGMLRRQVRVMITWESVIIAVLGAVLGILLGVVFGYAIVLAMRPQGITTFGVPIARLAIYVVAAGIFGVVAAVFPARRAAKMNPLAAISIE